MSYVSLFVLGCCAETKSHNNNNKFGRVSNAALASGSGLPVLLSLRKWLFKNDTFLLCSSAALRVKSTPLQNAKTGSFNHFNSIYSLRKGLRMLHWSPEQGQISPE